jgi:hypothetical protein
VIGRCIHKTGASLGPPSRGHLYSAETVFHVEVGAQYQVLGLGIFETVLVALVCDDTGRPNWLPAGVFEIQSQTLPSDWEFALIDGKAASGGDASNRWVARWGYAELARDERHSDALIERDPAGLEVFFRQLAQRSSERRDQISPESPDLWGLAYRGIGRRASADNDSLMDTSHDTPELTERAMSLWPNRGEDLKTKPTAIVIHVHSAWLQPLVLEGAEASSYASRRPSYSG